MGSREDHTMPHQPLLSSLVVRPSDSNGGGGGAGAAGGGSDYEPGEVRRDPPPYSRSERFSDNPGYRNRASSGSPVRRRNADLRYSPDIDRSGGPPRGRGFGGGRSPPPRYRDYSPPYGRGRGGGGRFADRGFDGPGFGSGPLRGEGVPRNNPNVRPRDGDWICPDLACNNLNFARREYCNNCNRPRFAPGGTSRSPPRRGYRGSPPLAPPRRFPAPPPVNRSPVRPLSSYRSPPRGWARDFRSSGGGPLPPPRYEGGRFPDPHVRKDRLDYPEDRFRDRSKLDWEARDRGRDSLFLERKGYDRRAPSPPLAPPPLPSARGRWPPRDDVRERSRSPIRNGLPPRREMYGERGRDDRHGMGRDRIARPY